MEKKRIEYIDIARGISIICVVLGHLGLFQINRVVFTFHIPIFYFITGYFINTKYSMNEFIKNKISTLLVPYFVTCLLIIVLGALKGLYINGIDGALYNILYWISASIYGAGDSYTTPFYIIGIGAIWFLWASFWGSVFLRFTLNKSSKFRITTILLLFIFGYYSRMLCWFPFSIQAGCCASLFMYLGYLLKNSKEIILSFPSEIKVVVTIFAFITFLSFIKNFESFWLVHCDIGRGIIDIFGCICACYIVTLISYYINKKSKFFSKYLSFLGKNSIFILCIHIIELNLFPWNTIINKLLSILGLTTDFFIVFIIIGKFLFIITLTVMLANWNISRKLFAK